MRAGAAPGGSGWGGLARVRRWLANPWGRPRILPLVTVVYLAWSILPILIAIRFSFNEGRSRSTAQGWSFRWYWEDPDLSVWHDPDLRTALFQSLRLAAIAVLVTVPLGVALALGLTRWRGRGAGTSRAVSLATLVTPEIVMGTALLLVFVNLLTFVPLGTPAQAIGHITFSLVFVLLIVRSRLLAIGRDVEEAARDLGATRLQAIRLALLPQLWPAVVASAIVVFALSMDDFVISQFLSSGTRTDTVPVRIYATGRTAPTPALNALATLTLAATIAIAALGFLLWWALRRARGQTGSTLDELAKLEAEAGR
ncbi:MAG: ABC transporter permease [Thermoleophilia bacterium]|nr:ABC transporter permease [Gaiellaceae bacterium]MDW8339534.1 ABC transporter permease [Thermoleophilia bacterium]